MVFLTIRIRNMSSLHRKTPLPWINYLGSNNFFSLISNTCGGYSFYKDAKLLRLTRYRYNNIPNDEGGRYYYIKDGNTVWNPGWQPVKAELDSYECRHGMGYSRFTSVKNGLKASLLAFVPVNDNCEVNQLTLTNESNEKKSFSVFSYIEFCLWNAMDDMTNYQRNLNIGEVEVIDSTIYHKTEYRERRNHFAVYSVNCPVDGFDTSRDEFLGAYRGVTDPQVVAEGKSHNSVACADGIRSDLIRLILLWSRVSQKALSSYWATVRIRKTRSLLHQMLSIRNLLMNYWQNIRQMHR